MDQDLISKYKVDIEIHSIAGDYLVFKVSIPAKSLRGREGAIHTYYVKHPMGDDIDEVSNKVKQDVQEALHNFHAKIESGASREEALKELFGTPEEPKLMKKKVEAEQLASTLADKIERASEEGTPTRTRPQFTKDEMAELSRMAASTSGREALTHSKFDTLRPKDISRMLGISSGIMGFAKNVIQTLSQAYPEDMAKFGEISQKITEDDINNNIKNVIINDGLVNWVAETFGINLSKLNSESGATFAAAVLIACATLKAAQEMLGE